MKKAFFVCLLVLASAGTVSAQSSARDFAARLNGSRFFGHDRSWSGAEVIYRSSSVATEADARRWWMSSPAHRRLLLSGAISDVACVGSVCVGRSSSSFSSSVSVSTGRRGPLRRLLGR